MKVSRVMICGSLWLTVMTTTMMTMMLSGTPVAMAAPRTTAASSKAAVPKVHKNNKNNKKAAEAIVQVKVEAPAPAVPAWKADLLHRAKVGFYFGLWYALNIVYNSTSLPTPVIFCRMLYFLTTQAYARHVSLSLFFLNSPEQKVAQRLGRTHDGGNDSVGCGRLVRGHDVDARPSCDSVRIVTGGPNDFETRWSLARYRATLFHD